MYKLALHPHTRCARSHIALIVLASCAMSIHYGCWQLVPKWPTELTTHF